MHYLKLEHADAIITAALAHGAEKGMKPLTVAVVDAGGALLALKRQDGSPNARPLVAQGKATGALALGISSRKIEGLAKDRPHFITAIGAITAAIVPVAGGVLIQGAEGRIIGAVGISGDTSDNDEACCMAGIAAAGLTAVEP
jgi:uncharacterized protein GlcG (DUF336 family)